jgi:FlaA1/EpsC-like NDP-sugar epimerase
MNIRRLIVFLHDVFAVAIAWIAAFWLRFNLDIPDEYEHIMLSRLPMVLLVHAVVFLALGLYRGLWRYASLPDLQRILLGVVIAAFVGPGVLVMMRLGLEVPRTAYLLTPVLLAAAMGGSRLAYRAWKEGRFIPSVIRQGATPVLVLGAGSAAVGLIKELASSERWQVVGLLDDDAAKRGASVMGVKVYGRIDDVGEVAKKLDVTQAVIAMPTATHLERKHAVEVCEASRLKVMSVPALSDIVSGRVSVSALRAIELDDLLGRDPVQLDETNLNQFLGGKTVLVTGAGGSIGSELSRQIERFGPARLVLLDTSELGLYNLEQEFRDLRGVMPIVPAIAETKDVRRVDEAFSRVAPTHRVLLDASEPRDIHQEIRGPRSAVEIVPVIGDAKDEKRVFEVFERYRPQIVFHAAAYKHVPLMEGDNAFQAVANNVLSTVAVAKAAAQVKAEKFVLVSTDKAVNPANVMGASKRLAEMVCQALHNVSALQFVIVRFGNVLGSTGSVVPRFRDQIARGGPVTVTHPAIERFFMSIPEAAQLVLQAGMMGKGGEIFVLDMGEPVKITDLARDLIRLSGFTEQDIRIEYTGLRPGEKLFEEPLADHERTLATPHPKLRVAKANVPHNSRLLDEVLEWLSNPSDTQPSAVRAKLRKWVSEYTGGA